MSDGPTGRDLIRALLPGGPAKPKALVIEATDVLEESVTASQRNPVP